MNPLRVAQITSDGRLIIGQPHSEIPSFGQAPEALLQGFAELPEVEVHVLSCVQQPLRSREKLAPNIRFHSLHVPKIGWLRTGYQGCIRAVRKKLREIKPDIVHGQGTERDCALSAVFSGFPNVVTIHGNMRLVARVNRARPFSFLWLAARLEGFVLPRTDGVVCITHYTRQAVNPLARKTWVVPNAVDASFFEIPRQPSSPPVIVCVGAVCLHKNQIALIRALDPLAARKKFKVVFLGSAPRDEAYGRQFFELLAVRPWCEHAGFVGREELKSRLSRATLLALPSLEDNCPMVVLEAAAAGVPVVAARVGGVPDLIADGQTGLLCDPQDAASMRNAVEKILTQPEWANALAAEAKKQARERFHPRVIAQRHLEIYREVLNTPS
ncbi:MAG TPA: glycosyltransferase family 4 protein [Verrucomicrobiae bacterium]|nr:glycosyltransferase family 4 protein [Verrucomicrobiae bacterium]